MEGLIMDASDDQQDIARGKGMVDTLFQAPTGSGTHHAIMNSYEYISQGLRQFHSFWVSGEEKVKAKVQRGSRNHQKWNMCCLFINDLDAAGRMGGTTNTMSNFVMVVNATLMNIADNPTNVQLPGMYNKQENARSLLLSLVTISPHCMQSLICDGQSGESSTGHQLGRTELVFAQGEYDDEVRKWISGTGLEQVGEKLLNSREGLQL
ncbi:hypothetical protein HAX54_002635 [Datura stramonium]|uniref:Uncharacterized protein n=1 Tax=Datura stramonium TaxID=4076 RepID=A0ABS8WWC7_DATST|nr:hypothetical protein [Datura stramonium]